MFLLIHSSRTNRRGSIVGFYTQRKLLWELLKMKGPLEVWTSTVNSADGSLVKSRPYSASYAVLCRLLLEGSGRVHIKCDEGESVFLIESVRKNPRSMP